MSYSTYQETSKHLVAPPTYKSYFITHNSPCSMASMSSVLDSYHSFVVHLTISFFACSPSAKYPGLSLGKNITVQ